MALAAVKTCVHGAYSFSMVKWENGTPHRMSEYIMQLNDLDWMPTYVTDVLDWKLLKIVLDWMPTYVTDDAEFNYPKIMFLAWL